MRKRMPREIEAYFDGFEAAGEAVLVIGQRLIAKRVDKLTPTQKRVLEGFLAELYEELTVHF